MFAMDVLWRSGPRERWRIKVAKLLLKSMARSLPFAFLVTGAGRWWTKGQLLLIRKRGSLNPLIGHRLTVLIRPRFESDLNGNAPKIERLQPMVNRRKQLEHSVVNSVTMPTARSSDSDSLN